jgi:twinkle protein
MSETNYISYALTKFRLLARETGIAVFIVAHPAKLYQDPKDASGIEKIPSLYNISGSAHWYNKCDFGLTVWRDIRKEIEGTLDAATVSVFVQKCRFGRHGGKGVAEFTFAKETGVYRAHPPEESQRSVRDWRGDRD